MDQFDALWTMLRKHGSSAKREHECVQLWRTYSPTLQQQIFNAICSKLEHNKFVHYDPLRAIQENARAVRTQTLSYKEYYAQYGTTEERDGWKMENPTGQKVIYVKTVQ